MRSLRKLYQIYEKLEIKYFDREYIKNIIYNFYILILYLLFINNFDIYKNIYPALKTFYFILIYLNYEKREKLANIFILLLKSYNAKINNIIKIFNKIIKNLNRNI